MTLLDKPTAYVMKMVLRRHHAAIRSATMRLKANKDKEALHDVRVGVRRLRSTIQTYGTATVPQPNTKEVLSRLKLISKLSNSARDTEVSLVWIKSIQQTAAPDVARGLKPLIREFCARMRSQIAHVAKELKLFEPWLLGELPELLSEFAKALDECEDKRFKEVVVPLGRKRIRDLEKKLRAVKSDNAVELHRVRISAKRLRYLLEPISVGLSGGEEIVSKLVSLQDCLGESNDLTVTLSSLRSMKRRDFRSCSGKVVKASSGCGGLSSVDVSAVSFLKSQAARRRKKLFKIFRDEWCGKAGKKQLAVVKDWIKEIGRD